ncbi:hypothetical protein BJ878DRAFT_482398 [Calycina marina]|uniref:Centrosomin N-terminal motif 1 domain-containing protein n=1 Tax=Calycina marina TaxID=1763456 RepID=A0A9P7YYG9_9HELO|nr:hypothetical protein BJ878DRAFT_482398 [Calycina marina]
MVDDATGSRRSRSFPLPESPASDVSRRTPSSGNSTGKFGRSARMSSGATLLQEKLRDRKAESAMNDKRSSMGNTGDIVSNSPAGANKRPSLSNQAMGLKKMDEHVSTLTKQNFNLKLELHHRRERQTELEARVEAAEKKIVEQAELQEINEQLLGELEKRDQAVEEAVGIIVSLEDKVAALMREREVVRNFDLQPEYQTGYSRTKHEYSNAQAEATTEKAASKAMARMPSFLSEQSDGVDALRSLYLPGGQSFSDANFPQSQEVVLSDDGLNSPRLSMLSESSFISIYGKKKPSPDEMDDEAVDLSTQRRHRASSSMSSSNEKWVDDPALYRNDNCGQQYLSLNSIITSPLQRLEKLHCKLQRNTLDMTSQDQPRTASFKEPRTKRDSLRRVVTEKGSFDPALPPTPDTISTYTLRRYQNLNAGQDKDANDTSFLNSTTTFRTHETTQNSFDLRQTDGQFRPRSAGETITSRRDGHGWDTETQDEFSANASELSRESSTRPGRVLTPDLFSFHEFNSVSGTAVDRWSPDEMYRNAAFQPPLMTTASKYQPMRESAISDHDDSEDTIRNISELQAQDDTMLMNPLGRSNGPNRRSSLGYAPKLRRNNTLGSSVQQLPTGGVFTSSPVKKQGFASRLFGRSETSPSMIASHLPSTKSPLRSPTPSAKSNFYAGLNAEDDDSARATPPPIMRNRATATRQRPSSAGPGSSTNPQREQRRASALPGQEPIEASRAEESGKGGGKKWMGLKSGSSRRP